MAGIRLVPEFPEYTGRFSDDSVGMKGTGACTLCNSHRPAADAGVIELGNNAQPYREGMVVICIACARQIGTQAGMIDTDKADRLLTERDEAVARAERLVDIEQTLPRLVSVARRIIDIGDAHVEDLYGADE